MSGPLRRAMLYVPASSKRFMEKTRDMKVDCVVYDLEDSVLENQKSVARANVCNFLQERHNMHGVNEIAVRINSLKSGLAEKDIAAVVQLPRLEAIVVPKVDSPSDLKFVSDAIQHYDRRRQTSKLPLAIIALIESAKAISNLSSICGAIPQLSGLIFGAEDFALDLSLTRTPSLSEFLYARSVIVTECRAHNLGSAIDLVCTSYKGREGQKTLEEECLGGKRLGFDGKQCIHPSQVDTVQRAFAPSDEELTWATRILTGLAKSSESGAWTLDGKMIDEPVMGKARALVSSARECGIDVDATERKWQQSRAGATEDK